MNLNVYKSNSYASSYDPSQPRHPKGSPVGGQWSKSGSVAGAAARSGAALPPKESAQKMTSDVAEWIVTSKGKVWLSEVNDNVANRRGHDYLADEAGEFVDDLEMRGLFGKIADRNGEKFDFISFYTLNGSTEPEVFFKYFEKIAKKIEYKLGIKDWSPAIYETDNFFDYFLYDPKGR